MKQLLLRSLFLPIALLIVSKTYAVSYVSAGAGPANWNSATSWTPNGIPTINDDVTISVGHTINVNASGQTCKNLTVAGTLNWTSNNPLTVRGTNYTLTGTESGTGSILFNGTSININGTGTFGQLIGYSFNTNATLAANTTINKNSSNVVIGINKTLTNLGNLTLNLFTYRAGSIFINSTNATLTIKRAGFMAGETFTANATGNSVNLQYTTGNIPTTTSGYYNLTIAGTVAGAKTLAANTVVANNLTINPTNTLNTNNFDLSVGASFTNNGTFTASTGKNLIFNGSSAQSISTAGTLALTNLTINNASGVNLASGSYSLSEVLTLSNGTLNTGGRTFTMLSTASQTARIAEVTGSGSVSGNFTIQRFISARDTTWSILSSPVQSTTMQDWDNELFIYYSTDYYQATAASYDEASASYLPVSSASKTISPMEGFEVYLLGDFSFSSIGNTTLNSIGVPNFGDQSMGLDYTAGTGYEGQNLVGNPFASSIDWSTVYSASSNIDNYADIYDYTTGNYASINLGDEIGSGQGFWVYALGAGATLNIPESAKTTSSNSSLRKAETPVFNLSIASADGSHSFAHRLELLGDMSYSNQKDSNDRLYRMSPNKKAPKITSIIDGKEFVRNAFNSSASNITFPLLVSVGLDGKYSISAQNMDALTGEYTCIILKDKKLSQSINLNEVGSYSFIATTKDAKDRFELELSKNGNCRSAIALSNVNIEDQVLVLPTTNGNSIAFNFTETLNTTVYVTNMLGQSIVEQFNVQANTQTIELGIPEDFSGMYIVTISNEKGMVSKKFVKK